MAERIAATRCPWAKVKRIFLQLTVVRKAGSPP
jgi:hypothetical protein